MQSERDGCEENMHDLFFFCFSVFDCSFYTTEARAGRLRRGVCHNGEFDTKQ
jgi:hypothetical protein